MSTDGKTAPASASEAEVDAAGQTSPAVATRTARKTAITAFVHDHPALLLAGGVATGLVIGSLLPRRTGKEVVRRTSSLSKLLGAAALSFGEDAAQRASVAGTQIRKGSHIVADRAEDWTAAALRSAGVLAQTAAENMTKLGETAAEKAEKFSDIAADRIGKAGDQASKGFDKAKPATQAAAAQAGKRFDDAIAQLRSLFSG